MNDQQQSRATAARAVPSQGSKQGTRMTTSAPGGPWQDQVLKTFPSLREKHFKNPPRPNQIPEGTSKRGQTTASGTHGAEGKTATRTPNCSKKAGCAAGRTASWIEPAAEGGWLSRRTGPDNNNDVPESKTMNTQIQGEARTGLRRSTCSQAGSRPKLGQICLWTALGCFFGRLVAKAKQ